MLYSTVAQVGFVALIGVTLFALSVDDSWVRLSALLHATNWMLVAALQRRHEHHIFQTADFITDVVGAVLACVIALRSGYLWAAALAAFQVLGALNWIAPLLDPSVLHRASITASYVWEAGALISLAAGATQARRVGARHASTAR